MQFGTRCLKGVVLQGSRNKSWCLCEDRTFWIVESLAPVTRRYRFDEALLVAPGVRDREEIVLEKRSIHTPIEQIIALTKRLNYELTPDIDGKWVFAQSNLNCALPDKYSSLRVRRVNEIADRFSVNLYF